MSNAAEIKIPKKKPKEELWLMSYADLVTNLMAIFVLLFAMSKVDVAKFDTVSSKVTKQKSHNLEELKKQIDTTAKNRGLTEFLRTELGVFGLHVEFLSGGLFASGSADIKPESYQRALPIFEILAKSDPKYLLSFEGHTDDVPLGASARYRDNWDLSSARGVSLLNKLHALGVPHQRMNIAGFADTRPRVPVAGKTGEELKAARASNRRLVIRVFQ